MTDENDYSVEGVNRTSSTLIERARQQDPLAWERLLSLYSPLVWRWCARAGLRPIEIEDVSQEVFQSVHRGLGNFQKLREQGSFRSWLRVIVNNKICDLHRNSTQPGVGGSDAVEQLHAIIDPVTSADDDEEELSILLRRVMEVMRTDFEETTWKAFWRVELDGLAVELVSTELNITSNAVYIARSRVRKRLRELFEELGEEASQ